MELYKIIINKKDIKHINNKALINIQFKVCLSSIIGWQDQSH